MLIDVGDEETANTAVTDLEIHSGQLVAGTSGIIRATIANHAARPLDHVALQVTVGNRAQPSKVVRELEP